MKCYILIITALIFLLKNIIFVTIRYISYLLFKFKAFENFIFRV